MDSTTSDANEMRTQLWQEYNENNQLSRQVLNFVDKGYTMNYNYNNYGRSCCGIGDITTIPRLDSTIARADIMIPRLGGLSMLISSRLQDKDLLATICSPIAAIIQ